MASFIKFGTGNPGVAKLIKKLGLQGADVITIHPEKTRLNVLGPDAMTISQQYKGRSPINFYPGFVVDLPPGTRLDADVQVKLTGFKTGVPGPRVMGEGKGTLESLHFITEPLPRPLQ